MIQIFIVDDHFLIGSGFIEEFDHLSEDFRIVGHSVNVLKAIDAIRKLQIKIDIIVLDLFIGFLDPVANFKILRKNFPLVPIIILSYETSLKWQILMFNQGISAYLSKGDDKSYMQNTIYQVANGKTIIPNEVLRFLGEDISDNAKSILLPEEKEIVLELATGKIIKQIAEPKNLTPSAIEKKIKSIREKFNVKTNCELIAYLSKVDLI